MVRRCGSGVFFLFFISFIGDDSSSLYKTVFFHSFSFRNRWHDGPSELVWVENGLAFTYLRLQPGQAANPQDLAGARLLVRVHRVEALVAQIDGLRVLLRIAAAPAAQEKFGRNLMKIDRFFVVGVFKLRMDFLEA